MRKINEELIFSPTDLSQFLKSPFVSWMQRYCLENPTEKIQLPENPTMKLLAEKGDQHEKKYLALLKRKHERIAVIDRSVNLEQSLRATEDAIRGGADIIYQGAFKLGNFAGYSDFLLKVDSPSNLGNFSYEVADTKLANRCKPEYILQLSCYTEMLAAIQGTMPKKFHVVFGNGEQESFTVDDFYSYYRHFKQRYLNFHKEFNSRQQPDPEPWEDLDDWEEYGSKILLAKDHLVQIAGIGVTQIKKLEKSGINTMAALAKAKKSDRPKGIQEETFERLVKQSRLQIATKKAGHTQFELRKMDSEQIYGLQRLPPSDLGDVYFDMEGFPLEEGGLEYLFGAVLEEKSKTVFKDWWAVAKSDEKEAFEAWIDWVYKRFKSNPQMHIYHYAAYEVTAMKKLMGLYMTREHEVDELLRNGVFVDLYQIVREGLIVGEDSYSIKKLESLYEFRRQGDVKTAGDSVVQFANWLEIKDGESWKDSIILKEIRDYNEEDCVSTLKLTQWLRSLQKKEKIKYVPTEAAAEESVETERSESDILLQKMLKKKPSSGPESQVHEILSAALGYHRREAKPQWWSFFSRQSALPEELVEDFDCLAKCKITKKTTNGFFAKFDPDQETKMNVDSSFVLHQDQDSGTIESIDFESGIVQLRLKSALDIGNEVTLLPHTPISTKPIENSIFETATEWNSHRDLKKLRPALKALLCQDEPTIKGRKKHAPVVSEKGTNLLAEVISVTENLQESILAIQGPPGTGKTYTASHVIADLLLKGYKVGVTSNGHKAINLLLIKVAALVDTHKKAGQIKIAKVRSESETDIAQAKRIAQFTSARDYWKKGANSDLVGGTSWFFSAQDSVDKFDYLFIEEAGQFSLANAIAVQRAAKNLVLLGDQMQLEQPIQGTHPDCIAHSVLNFYLNGHDTVPPNMGVFLGVSRRMRPEVCDFISKTFYENRLVSHASTKDNVVTLSERSLLSREFGLLFVPVRHEGNTQGSEEEVEAIRRIVNDLLKAKVTDSGDKSRKMTLKDILFVAPYNLQVGLIESELGAEAKVGSVDLFQGQESSVVILSMCSSDGESSPRGLEFILNRNRLNVAISRAKSLAIVVGSPTIADTRCSSVKNMRLLNLLCSIMEDGVGISSLQTRSSGCKLQRRQNQ